MLFNCAILSGLAAVVSAVPATQVVTDMERIADMSTQLTGVAQELERSTLYQDGNELVTGLKGIISFTQTYTQEQQADGVVPYADTDATDIVGAYHEFVSEHTTLLTTLVGKQEVINATPFGTLLGALLRMDGAAQDAYGSNITTALQSGKEDFDGMRGVLGKAFADVAGKFGRED